MKPLLATLILLSVHASASDLPKHKLPPSPDGSLVIGNCDGENSVEVKGKKPGDKLSPAEAQGVANQLMAAWQKKHPGAKWVGGEAENKGRSAEQKGSNDEGVKKQQGTYSAYTAEDEKLWKLEQDKLIKAGDQIFHDGSKVGATTGMACAMCHPNGSNTHPETYPKFQVQLQRVAMLRDMINWCLENPLKAPLLKDDDPRMRALEAYIISQRAGKVLEPGKH